ncbi:hypothetical protein U9M48_005287 [Paspalum notatum var. saurae]|uniref:RING-type domain-containing protein n=1 Tax=Paspalum notatum var. saurae TaxID=547442 RepID=A0AAQ3PWK7_PASNO
MSSPVVNRHEVVVDGVTHVIATISYEESSAERMDRLSALIRAEYNRNLRRRERASKRARLAASGEAVRGLRPASAGDAGVPGDCAVCLQDFCAEDTLRAMPCSQSHAFHQDCILGWLRVNHVCPLCRHALPTQQEEEESQDYHEDGDDEDEDADEDDDSDSEEDDDYEQEDGYDGNYSYQPGDYELEDGYDGNYQPGEKQ